MAIPYYGIAMPEDTLVALSFVFIPFLLCFKNYFEHLEHATSCRTIQWPVRPCSKSDNYVHTKKPYGIIFSIIKRETENHYIIMMELKENLS